MPLSPGDKLGNFDVLSLLGRGGMGEVYRARDTQLKRDVALKVLPAVFSSDPDRLARFQREAELLASLDHPNIGHIYGMVQSERNWALVLALIEGPTLDDRIKQGPLPADEAIAISKQIIDALEYAHDHGVIHRDLKPANIKVTPDGVVKVLDFGLAKALDQRRETSLDPENSPTLTMGATQAGVIMGTAAYMSPEQAVGKPADRRSDIFSFGVVLYEMLTGKRPFRGESVGDTLAAVVKDTPDWSALPEGTPSHLRKLLERMLAKDRKERLQAIGEARIALARPQADETPRQTEMPALPKRPWALAAATATFALVAGVVSFIHFREIPPLQQTTRYSITVPESSSIHSFALSPDGRTLVMAASVSGKRQLYLRSMDALQFQPMAFTEEATYPFWSPDSRYIGFFAQGKLKKVSAGGGPSLALCDAQNGRGGTWNRDDVIVFSPTNSALLQRVPAAGGVPAEVIKTPGSMRHPVFLPDGRHFLYTNQIGEQAGIHVASLDQTGTTKEDRRILPDVSSAQFAPPERSGQPGHLLFVRQDTLMAVPFDASSAQVSGDVFPLADGTGFTTNVTYAPVTVSENGVLLYEAGGAGGGDQLAWVDRTGKQLGPVAAPGEVFYPAISPDEKQVVFARNSGAFRDLWLRDLSRGTETRFTSNPSLSLQPVWSPKGDRIVFGSNRKDAFFNLYSKAANGGGQDEILLQSSLSDFPDQWSRDGRFLVFYRSDPKTLRDLWVLPMAGPEAERAAADRKPIPFLQSEFNEFLGQLSPDSHWMAFTSDRSGRREVYVRPFPSGESEYTISIAGGEMPRWRSDGKELFFVGADGKMTAVLVKAAVGAKAGFEADAPTALFDAQMAGAGTSFQFEYDVTADGKRFLIRSITSGTTSAPPLTVVTNWQAGVKK